MQRRARRCPMCLRSFVPLFERCSAFSINPFSQSANHPLKLLEPKVKRMQQPSILFRTISRPMCLTTLRKIKQGGDSEDSKDFPKLEDEQPKLHWFKPVTNLFAKKAAPNEEFVNRPIA
jgi:hypothetical protein